MTKKLEISRELAERIIECFPGSWLDKELRALLTKADDADKVNNREMGLMQFVEKHADQVPPLIQALHANGDRIAMEATIAQQAQEMARLKNMADNYSALLMDANARIADLERGRGEPVYQTCNGVDGWIDVDLVRYTACRLDPEEYDVRILYTAPVTDDGWYEDDCGNLRYRPEEKQPAPVAAVLPEHRELSKKMFDDMSPFERDISFKDIGWNACLDKVKELNQ